MQISSCTVKEDAPTDIHYFGLQFLCLLYQHLANYDLKQEENIGPKLNKV